MLTGVGAAQRLNPNVQNQVVVRACLGRGSRSGRIAVEPRNQSQGRQVGNDQLRSSGLDETLDVERLIDACVDNIVCRRRVNKIIGSAPDNEEGLVGYLSMSCQVIANLLADVFDVD